MPKSSLETLVELAEGALDVAAKSLGRAIRTKDEAVQQLNLLIQYRSDYEARLQHHAQAGLMVTQYANFQAFIGKLDEAIEGQKKIIQDAEYKVIIATKNWQTCEMKRLSYQTLVKRNEQQVVKKEAKKDQKQTDEAATRAFSYKRSTFK